MILNFGSGAATRETDAAHHAIPHKTMTHLRSTCFFVIFVSPLFNSQRSGSGGAIEAILVLGSTCLSLQTPMPSMSTTPDCPGIQNVCLRREPGHHRPALQADA